MKKIKKREENHKKNGISLEPTLLYFKYKSKIILKKNDIHIDYHVPRRTFYIFWCCCCCCCRYIIWFFLLSFSIRTQQHKEHSRSGKSEQFIVNDGAEKYGVVYPLPSFFILLLSCNVRSFILVLYHWMCVSWPNRNSLLESI